MAFDYSLELETDMTASQALELLVKELGLERDGDQYLRGTGISITARKTDSFDQSIIEADFGFRSSLLIRYRPDGADPEVEDKESYDILAKSVVILLLHTIGNAVLLLNSEQVYLQRKGNLLILNKGWEEWLCPQFDAMQVKYEVNSMHSPVIEGATTLSL